MLLINLSHKPRLWSSPAPCLAKSPCSVLCYLQWHSDVFALEPGGSVAGAVRCVPCQALTFSHYWRPCFHTSYPLQSLWLSSHPRSLSLYRISHGWVTRRWPTGVYFAFLQTTFVPSHQHFSHVCFILLGGFFSRKKKKKDLPRSAQKRRKHLGWADQFAWPQGKRSAWLMPQKAIGPGDHPSMWITGLAVASVWSREGIPIQAARHPLFGKAAKGDSCSVLWPQEHS